MQLSWLVGMKAVVSPGLAGVPERSGAGGEAGPRKADWAADWAVLLANGESAGVDGAGGADTRARDAGVDDVWADEGGLEDTGAWDADTRDVLAGKMAGPFSGGSDAAGTRGGEVTWAGTGMVPVLAVIGLPPQPPGLPVGEGIRELPPEGDVPDTLAQPAAGAIGPLPVLDAPVPAPRLPDAGPGLRGGLADLRGTAPGAVAAETSSGDCGAQMPAVPLEMGIESAGISAGEGAAVAMATRAGRVAGAHVPGQEAGGTGMAAGALRVPGTARAAREMLPQKMENRQDAGSGAGLAQAGGAFGGPVAGVPAVEGLPADGLPVGGPAGGGQAVVIAPGDAAVAGGRAGAALPEQVQGREVDTDLPTAPMQGAELAQVDAGGARRSADQASADLRSGVRVSVDRQTGAAVSGARPGVLAGPGPSQHGAAVQSILTRLWLAEHDVTATWVETDMAMARIGRGGRADDVLSGRVPTLAGTPGELRRAPGGGHTGPLVAPAPPGGGPFVAAEDKGGGSHNGTPVVAGHSDRPGVEWTGGRNLAGVGPASKGMESTSPANLSSAGTVSGLVDRSFVPTGHAKLTADDQAGAGRTAGLAPPRNALSPDPGGDDPNRRGGTRVVVWHGGPVPARADLADAGEMVRVRHADGLDPVPDGTAVAGMGPLFSAAAGPYPVPDDLAGRALPGLARALTEVVRTAPDGPVEITLAPEELGKVRVTLLPHSTGITLTILAERSDTLDLMRRHIEGLAQELRGLGYANVSFDFGQSPSGQSPSQRQASLMAPGTAAAPGADSQTGQAGPPALGAAQRRTPVVAGELDLRL